MVAVIHPGHIFHIVLTLTAHTPDFPTKNILSVIRVAIGIVFFTDVSSCPPFVSLSRTATGLNTSSRYANRPTAAIKPRYYRKFASGGNAETLDEQYDPVLPSPLYESSARKPLSALLPSGRKINAAQPVVANAVHRDVMCQSNQNLSAAPIKLSNHNTRNWSAAGTTISCRHRPPSKRFERSYADHLPLYLQSETYRHHGGS